MLVGKPNFTQNPNHQMIRAMEFKIHELEQALRQQAAMTGLLEAALTGVLSNQYWAQSEPEAIAQRAIEVAGAVAAALTPQPEAKESEPKAE